jgi:hypothetical protein
MTIIATVKKTKAAVTVTHHEIIAIAGKMTVMFWAVDGGGVESLYADHELKNYKTYPV